MAVVHDFVSAAAVGPDPAKVRSPDWNADHNLTGGTNGDLVTRATASSDGMALLASVAVGRVLCSSGAATAPAGLTRAVLEGIQFPGTDPSAPADGLAWITATGTTPSLVIALKFRWAGVTRTLISVTF
jgi:hypothetical protein